MFNPLEPTMTISADGVTRKWYLNDKLHREDGPAIEYADGTKYWYLNDKLHREDGPAMEYADGTKSWYLNGKEIDQLVFWVTTKERALTATEDLGRQEVPILL